MSLFYFIDFIILLSITIVFFVINWNKRKGKGSRDEKKDGEKKERNEYLDNFMRLNADGEVPELIIGDDDKIISYSVSV